MKAIFYVFAILLLIAPSVVSAGEFDAVYSHTDSAFNLAGCLGIDKNWAIGQVVKYFNGEISHDTVMMNINQYFYCNP